VLDKIRKSKTFRKAYTAALTTLGGAIGTALVAGTLTGGVAIAAAGAALLAFVAVYNVPNAQVEN
jgi:hypothetical protein